MADGSRVLPEHQLPNDQRLQPPKDLDGYFPFKPSSNPDAWAKRAQEVRQQIQVATGLMPPPPRTPLNAVIHGKVDRDNYTVEKVYFESVPGFFVTGNLYRPKGKPGPFPGVLCPHGHWDNGRFMDYGPERVRQEIVQGAERFEEGGRSVLQARCVQLARMGCVVFHYDMIGYADSQQLSFDLAHRFAEQRPEMNTTVDWGLYSPQAEAHLQSIMGLQTWNSIRALDFLLELPGVDSQRLAVTGASGGGTQTFMVCALDPRPALAFPAVMVSTAMQGGCTCENASLLRVDTGNVEFAALFAPKPLGMTAANDWTKEMPSKGFPQLKQHYAMMGASENVMLKPLVHFDHNYNYVSRAAMYGWVNKHFKLGLAEPILEQDYQRLTQEEMSVWDAQHPRPESGPAFERKLLRWLTDDANRQIQQASSSVEEWRRTVGRAMDVVIGRNLAQTGPVSFEAVGSEDKQPSFTLRKGLLRNSKHEEELPVLFLQPAQPSGRTVIWASESGKAGLFTGDTSRSAQPKPEIAKLLAAGVEVVGVDLLYQGEFLSDGKPLSRTPRVKNPREAAAYTFGYNRAVFAERVHDLLSVISFLQARQPKPGAIDLAGLDSTGPLVAAARAQAGDAIRSAAIFTGGFRFGGVLDLQTPDFLPGGAKYGDVPGLLALAAPGKLWLGGEGDHAPELVQNMYKKAQAADNLSLSTAARSDSTAAAVKWLIGKE
jgi:dienelactone hydrolase